MLFRKVSSQLFATLYSLSRSCLARHPYPRGGVRNADARARARWRARSALSARTRSSIRSCKHARAARTRAHVYERAFRVSKGCRALKPRLRNCGFVAEPKPASHANKS
eukprot:2926224-Pleurochrysis_carterae.AAC.1